MTIRIAICAPATPILPQDEARLRAIAAGFDVDLHLHPQCFVSEGHFAGSDDVRLAALLDCANDPGFDAVWFARGGYGSNRIAARAVAGMNALAGAKAYLGYSDMGYLLGALYGARIGRVAHGPMVADGRRAAGEAALARALGWLTGAGDGLEPSLAGESHPVVAFNLCTLAMLCGTPMMPGLAGHVVMVEEVSEHLYAIDRLMFHATAHLASLPEPIAGLRLGRVSDVPENDRPFGSDVTAIARDWCARHAIPFLGAADIGHDADNKIVPFGLATRG
ncbi:LD-carboxypeptidase [Novosphingobium sp. FSY-8]|uniref:LD-carboxypeptidase n=1 Tax=Novosphingobium ovatum TaxID=1908523 RepID=A0ABW9XB77_9SPHN|nr:LD-carboxypeptidase [Novosphingobium ovatum]NBC35773.1 LD-carboxypeptidase [Novosphingobium ovatum]